VPTRRAFTLIELLVVLAIISLLISIIAPTLGQARKSAERTGCAANLREVGQALRSYLDNNEDKLPWASWMPSYGPFPISSGGGGGGGGGGLPPGATPDPIAKPVYIADVLQKDTVGQYQIFKCPGDKDDNDRPDPNRGKSFFRTEKSSYVFRWQAGGQTMKEYAEDMQHRFGVVPVNSIWVFRDFDNFHGPGGKPGARRYLFIDGHVTDFELH
jgi:prepilin-type N-terminal cleavage/methylation domain-containing protein